MAGEGKFRGKDLEGSGAKHWEAVGMAMEDKAKVPGMVKEDS